MTLHQITTAEWDAVLGPKGKAQPGDMVELLPGVYTGQDFKIRTPGVTVQAAGPGVKFDGQYKWPAGRTANTGPGGDVTWEPLIQIFASDVHLELDGAELIRSRGAGVGVSGTEQALLTNVKVNGLKMTGLRAGAIRFDWTDGFEAARNIVTDAGNYWPAFREGSLGGWPMVINCVASQNGELHHNIVTDCWGEGVNVSRGSKKTKVYQNHTAHLMGAHYYLHGCEDVDVFANVGLEYDHYLRGAGPGYIFVINPGEPQYIGKQSLIARRLRLFNNIARGGMHNFGLWAEGDEPCENILIAHNTFVNAQRGKRKDKPAQALVIRGGKNVKGLKLIANMLHQADGQYGTVDKAIAVEWDGNGWDGLPPPAWNTKNDFQRVALKNPDGDPLDIGNYEPTVPAGLLTSTGVDEDFTGKKRKIYSPGALEYQTKEQPPVEPPVEPPPPPMPTTETVGVMFVMDVDPAIAPAVRAALNAAKVTVS